jgi:hypothetical protein
MRKIKLILFIIAVFLNSIAIVSPLIQKQINADIQPLSGFGNDCVDSYTACPAGSKNLIESILNGNIAIHAKFITQDEAIGAVRKKYGNNANSVCIPDSINELIQHYIFNAEDQGLTVDNPGGPGFDDITIRTCPSGYDVSEATKSGDFGGFGVVGCCPANYRLVTAGTNVTGNGDDYQEDSRCCYVPPGTSIGHPDYPVYTEALGANECQNENGEQIFFTNNSTYMSHIRSLGVESGTIDGMIYVEEGPVEGDPLVGSINPVARTTAAQICPDSLSDGCAIVAGSDTVIDPDTLNSTAGTSMACNKCYAKGDPITIDTATSELVVCDGNGATIRQELINGNVRDTIAFLIADETNQPLLQDCREKGGIFIAIGCVDPTPTGIITGLIRLSFGVMGGVALIQLILAGIAYQSGDEAKIKEARSKVIATLTGIAVLVFSVLILRILGINVLDVIPSGSV